jgi:hypothetical protein
MNKAFQITVTGKPWPFQWGPFGRPKSIDVDVGSVIIRQRNSDKATEVSLCNDGRELIALLDFGDGTRFRRRSFVG